MHGPINIVSGDVWAELINDSKRVMIVIEEVNFTYRMDKIEWQQFTFFFIACIKCHASYIVCSIDVKLTFKSLISL